VEDDEDDDDELPEDDDGELEPLPDDMELEVPDEAEMIRAAKEAAEAAGQLRDFNMARRVARQDGYAVQPVFEGQQQSQTERAFKARKQAIYDAAMAEHERVKGRKPTPRQRDRIWNDAEQKAMEEVSRGGDEGGENLNEGRRVSARARRSRV
jgi:hypothetical protein